MKHLRSILILIVSSIGLWGCAAHMGGGRIGNEALYTARSFLVGAQTEQADYGLYSYLLLPAPPQPQNKARYAAAVRAFLGHPPAPAMEALLPRESLNVFYLMLLDSPSPNVTRCLEHNCYPVDDAVVDWILANYNYARARLVLHCASATQMSGPCIVTFTRPVPLPAKAQFKPTAQEALLQDLSTAPPQLVNHWVELFMDQATGKGSAFEHKLSKLKLCLIGALENYAKGLPQVIEACRYIALTTASGR